MSFKLAYKIEKLDREIANGLDPNNLEEGLQMVQGIEVFQDEKKGYSFSKPGHFVINRNFNPSNAHDNNWDGALKPAIYFGRVRVNNSDSSQIDVKELGQLSPLNRMLPSEVAKIYCQELSSEERQSARMGLLQKLLISPESAFDKNKRVIYVVLGYEVEFDGSSYLLKPKRSTEIIKIKKR